jgi:small conductance mechanosensitive channel
MDISGIWYCPKRIALQIKKLITKIREAVALPFFSFNFVCTNLFPVKIHNYFEKLINLLLEYAPKVASALVVLLVGLWLIKRIAILAQKSFEKRELDVSLRTFLRSLISIGLKIILIVTVAGMIGIGTASFVTILGAAGLAVGLALQGSLSNFAGGVLILIFKPYKVGDTIEAQSQTGEVLEIQIFNTIVLTADHKTVIFPNGVLSNGTIINYSKYGNLRTDITVSVSVDNDLALVKQIILEVLDTNAYTLKKPEPIVVTSKISEGAVTINIKPYFLPDNVNNVISSVNEELKSAFRKNGIQPAVPIRMVHQT